MDSNEWPLSAAEIAALRAAASQSLSFVSVMNKYDRKVESIAATVWTHKCICPSPDHKNGYEKTPSFFFSEKDKTFMCFGCHIRGDIFDVLAIYLKQPSELLAKGYAKNSQITLADLGALPTKPQFDNLQTQHYIGLMIRDYVRSAIDKPNYAAICSWADAMFLRVDEKFSKLKDEDGRLGNDFLIYVSMEIERRKSAEGIICG